MNKKKLNMNQILDRVHEMNHSPRDQLAGAKVVDFLKEQFSLSDGDNEFSIWVLLADRLSLLSRMSEAENVYKEIAETYPEYSQSWHKLAEFYMINDQLVRAAEMMDKAIQIALSDGEFVIMMYTTRARIARQAKDWKTLSSVISRLVEYERPPGSRDYFYECDFVVGLPEGAVEKSLVERLENRCRG